jgi:hypothetical protein
MFEKFPDIKANTDNHGKLRMYTGKIAGDNRVKGPDYGELTAIFLSKVTKGKEFYFHVKTSIPRLWPMSKQQSSRTPAFIICAPLFVYKQVSFSMVEKRCSS